jgi:hypothetical protein
MKVILIVLVSALLSCNTLRDEGHSSIQPGQVHSVADLQSDFLQLRHFLESSHPQLYRFTPKKVFDSLFEAQFRLIDHPMTTQEFYPVLIPLVARVGCGHTSLWSPEGFWENAPRGMFPLRVHARNGELFVIQSFDSTKLIRPGSRIISVNGRDAGELVKEMVSRIWSDGFIETGRYQRLNSFFPYLYALNYGFPGQFELELEENGMEKKMTLEPVSSDRVDEFTDSLFVPGGARNRGLHLSLVNGQTAVLIIGSFAYYDDNKGFKRFIDSSFAVIHEKGIENLVIDLRGNDGGDPFCSSHLLRYLEREPAVYFREKYGQYASLNQPIPTAPIPFRGRQYYLIDGICFSTTGHFTSLLKYHGLGTFVGEESGATFTCNDASHDQVLEHTGYRVQSARRSFAAAAYGFPLNRGILPDHYVQPDIRDLTEGRDVVMAYTMKLISGGQAINGQEDKP